MKMMFDFGYYELYIFCDFFIMLDFYDYSIEIIEDFI